MLMIICCVLLVMQFFEIGTVVLEDMIMMILTFILSVTVILNRNWLSRIFYNSEES